MTQLKVAEARKATGCEGAGLVIRSWRGNQACFFSTRIPLLTLWAPSYGDGRTEGGSDNGSRRVQAEAQAPVQREVLGELAGEASQLVRSRRSRDRDALAISFRYQRRLLAPVVGVPTAPCPPLLAHRFDLQHALLLNHSIARDGGPSRIDIRIGLSQEDSGEEKE